MPAAEFRPISRSTFGARYGERSAEAYYFDRAAPLYAGQGASDPNGCYVKWKAFDVQMNSAVVRRAMPTVFTPPA
jgi:hypothetical protein